MASGIPVRLSEALTLRARSEAAVQDRSVTEQVEHWARLGWVLEAAVSATTIQKLKARSYDPGLPEALAFADTSEGQAAAAEMIRAENTIRFEETTAGSIVALARDGKRTKVTAKSMYRPGANGAASSGDQLAARRSARPAAAPRTTAKDKARVAQRAAIAGSDHSVKLARSRTPAKRR